MPGRNVRKIYAEDSYYHAYNRGVNKEPIFRDDEDYRVFLNLLKRLLSHEPEKDIYGRVLSNYHDIINLNAYCLMPNHFHLLLHQKTSTGITRLFRSLSTSYSLYFNKKHGRVGHLFQDNFRASLINNDEYFRYISCYIHLNPNNYKEWSYSSLPYYLGTHNADWIKPECILGACGNSASYLSNLEDLSQDMKTREYARRILCYET